MKRTASEKNSIIIWFIFYFILLTWLILFFFISIVGSLNKIEEKKDDTKKIYSEIKRIEVNGLSYDEFKKIVWVTSWSDEYKAVLKNMTEEFYEKHLMNKTEKSFDEFIKNKTKEIKSPKNEKLILENEKQIVNILPTYSENNISIWENTLTDFEFINYVESILDTFNLTTKSPIWIRNIRILEDYVVSTWGWNSMDSNIYSIPLSINLVWTKKNIIDFLYFIENVWNIKTKDNEIIIDDNSEFLSNNWFKRVLSWEKYSSDYNIFEHQIIDISSITLNKYLDTLYISRNDKNFIDFIKETQWNDLFEVKVNLNFYVKWLPKYRVIDSIDKIIWNYKLLNTYVNKSIWKWDVKGAELLKLKKYKSLLKNIWTRVVKLSKDLRSNKNLVDIYNSALSINENIKPLCDKYIGVCK